MVTMLPSPATEVPSNLTTFRDLLGDLANRHKLPPGTDTWALRTERSSRGFTWPEKGWAYAPGPMMHHDGVAPLHPGDGLCVAFTWAGMATAPIVADKLLLVAFASKDQLSKPDRLTARVRRAYVVAKVDGLKLLSERSFGGALQGARLELADLRGAALMGANLSGAILTRAALCGASLYGATLYAANLQGADLRGTDLRWTDLTRANLAGAKVDETTRLVHADLTGINAAHVNMFAADWRRDV